jgi:hypothetical protein
MLGSGFVFWSGLAFVSDMGRCFFALFCGTRRDECCLCYFGALRGLGVVVRASWLGRSCQNRVGEVLCSFPPPLPIPIHPYPRVGLSVIQPCLAARCLCVGLCVWHSWRGVFPGAWGVSRPSIRFIYWTAAPAPAYEAPRPLGPFYSQSCLNPYFSVEASGHGLS